MSPHHEQLVAVLGMLGLEGCVAARCGRGRPPRDRACMARAFVAKAIFQFPTTRALLDRLHCDAVLRRLCGWQTAAAVPDETVFSRAFGRFAASQFPQRVHEKLVVRSAEPATGRSCYPRFNSYRGAGEGEPQTKAHGQKAKVPATPFRQTQTAGKDDAGGAAVLRHDDTGTDAAGVTATVRCGLQEQQPRQ